MNVKTFRNALVLCLFTASVGITLAAPRPNLDKEGVALQGYDPVAFFTDGKPVLGQAAFHSAYHDATYRFASAEHQAIFEKNPEKYEPQFGGYCAYGVSQGHTAPIKIEAFQIVNGRLLMQYDSEVKDLFNKDARGNLEAADQKWPDLTDKKP